MPYIPQTQRPEIDAIVDPLVAEMGACNYLVADCLTRIIMRIAKGVCLGGLSPHHPHPIPQPSLAASANAADSLIDLLNAVGYSDEIAGRLNYAISRTVWALCGHCGMGVRRYARMNAVDSAIDLAHDDFRRWVNRSDSDGRIALFGRMHVVNGAIGLAHAEFRRRMVSPYEDEKIESAGDVWLDGRLSETDAKQTATNQAGLTDRAYFDNLRKLNELPDETVDR